MSEPQLTLHSTTDSLQDVQKALGVTPDPAPAPDAAAAATAAAPPPVVADPAPAVAEPVAAAPAADVKPKSKPKDGLQSRIDELVRERDTARGLGAAQSAELDGLRAKVKELAGGAPAAPKLAATATAEEPEPKVEDFPDYDTFIKASILYHSEKIADKRVKEAMAATKSTAQEEAARQANEALLKAHDGRLVDARASYEDFDTVVGVPDVAITTLVRDGIVASEIGPHVAYYLATHPEEREKLNALGTSLNAVRLFGRIEEKVERELANRTSSAASGASEAPAASTPAIPAASAAPAAAAPAAAPAAAAPQAPAAQAVTRAPDPITPVGGAGGVITTVNPDQMSYAEFKRWRETKNQPVGAR